MGVFAGSMAQAGLMNQIAGMGSSAAGAYYGARNQASNFQFQGRMADINARIAESAAQTELLKGQQQSAALTLQAGHLRSRQRAALAGNGVDLGEGSAAEMLASTDLMKEVDIQTTLANAVRSAWGYRVQKANYQMQSVMANASAKGVRPLESTVSSLLGNSGQVASSWYTSNKAGALGRMGTHQTSDPIYAMGSQRGWWGK